jgi:hypothetical protein
MSSVATSGGLEVDELSAQLRHPMETPALVACIAANLAVLALALVIVQVGSDWLETHPNVAGRVQELRIFAMGVILAWPLTVLGRYARIFAVRANGVRVSPENMPELHEIFVEQCRALHVAPIPELYLLRGGEGVAVAYSTFGERSCIVLDADLLFSEEWKENVDCIAFATGEALGSLSLGHTRWWVNMMTAYAIGIPALRGPLITARMYSRDRCAAFVAREGVRGLLIRATAKDLLAQVDVAAFIRDSLTPRKGFWYRVSSAVRPHPRLHERVRLLYESGFFDLEHDLARWGEGRASAR